MSVSFQDVFQLAPAEGGAEDGQGHAGRVEAGGHQEGEQRTSEPVESPEMDMLGWTFPLDLAKHKAKHCPNQISLRPLREDKQWRDCYVPKQKRRYFPSLTLALSRRGMKGSGGISEMSFRSSKPLLSMSGSASSKECIMLHAGLA